MTDARFVVTCEHGGNRIPRLYRHLFLASRARLESHLGYDPGALSMARTLAIALEAPLVFSTVSRLVVDLNRSMGHPRLFSPETASASAELRRLILATHYRPYRATVERLVAEAVACRGRAIHVSSHSFTPELDGVERTADVGLLYDPARDTESALCARWKILLTGRSTDLRVRRNYPYKGTGDGLTSYLRRRFSDGAYAGIELEVNQAFVSAGGRRWRALRRALVDTFRTACSDCGL